MSSSIMLFCESASGRTGIPRFVQALSQRLVNLSDAGVNIRLQARWLHQLTELDDIGVHYHTNPLPGRLQSWLRTGGMRDDWLYGRSQVVHEMNYMHSRVSAKTRIVMTVHDLGWRRSSVNYGISERFVQDAELAITRAHRIIAPTTSVKRDIVHFLGVPPDRISVISPGIDEIFLQASRSSCSLSLPERYWLFVGAYTPRKNLEKAVEAIARQADRLALVIVGPYIHYLDHLMRKATAEHVRIIHLEGVSDQELVHIYRNCTGLVYPSLWEGFGFPIVEAAAVGAPVITSDNTAMKEIGQGYAWLIDPQDRDGLYRSLEEVQRLSVEERQALSARGRDLALSFSWDTAARQHLRLYREELEAAKRSLR